MKPSSDSGGAPIQTVAGMHPLHWKHSAQATSGYQVRSARGIIKFSQTDSFSYELPSVGVLPTLPTIGGTFDQATLEGLVSEFIAQGSGSWNTFTDTYWSGKMYGKVAELIAIADSIGMDAEAAQLRARRTPGSRVPTRGAPIPLELGRDEDPVGRTVPTDQIDQRLAVFLIRSVPVTLRLLIEG